MGVTCVLTGLQRPQGETCGGDSLPKPRASLASNQSTAQTTRIPKGTQRPVIPPLLVGWVRGLLTACGAEGHVARTSLSLQRCLSQGDRPIHRQSDIVPLASRGL